jgi:glycosyltransferase involved in cell wall biosynthesis
VLPFVPSGLRRQLERELRRRYHPELDPGMLRTLGYWEWIERIGVRLGQRRLERYANEWGNASFARRVTRWVLRDGVDCLWGFFASYPASRVRRSPGSTSSDVLVLPSLFEGSSMEIYGALASGLPVVTTPNSGSIVRDGIMDCIVSIRDVGSLVSSVEFPHQERHARVVMGRRARQRALKFRWSRYTGGMVQMAERVA